MTGIREAKYGIAETFTSVQGEGLWTGTRMHFIRFSGCSVGKKLTEEEQKKFLMAEDVESMRTGIPVLNNLPGYREKCTLYDGREFLCDTNFQTAQAMTAYELVNEIPHGVDHICLTGGEPLDRNLDAFLTFLFIIYRERYHIHIETSGTKCPFWLVEQRDKKGSKLWITVSPKNGALLEMIDMADEIKLLVDENFDVNKLPLAVHRHPLVWISPVNYEHSINKGNMTRCLKLQETFPNFRLTLQAHKIWGVR